MFSILRNGKLVATAYTITVAFAKARNFDGHIQIIDGPETWTWTEDGFMKEKDMNQVTEETKQEKPKRTRKSSSIQLVADNATLTIHAKHKSSGQVQTRVTHAILTGKDKKSGKDLKEKSRGMTEIFPNLDAAEKAIAKMLAEAQKRGWTVKERKPRGFVAKPDEFSELPMAPGKVANKGLKKSA